MYIRDKASERFDVEGQYGIPVIYPEKVGPTQLIGFNYALSSKEPEHNAVHFFLDDYQFERVWAQPGRYMGILKRFQAVLSPDFSLYTDDSKAIQIYNHYRKHYLAALWQRNGLKVIPTIAWSDEESYSWCFDGEPTRSIVAVSSVGTQADLHATQRFIAGYQAMMEALRPSAVIFYGKVPEGISGNIISVPAYQERYKEVSINGWKRK